MTPAIGFMHQNNTHSTIDSICLACFITVATVAFENDLSEIEALHTCNSRDIRHPLIAADYSTLMERVFLFLDHRGIDQHPARHIQRGLDLRALNARRDGSLAGDHP
jgi:hypothetical protein